MSNNGKVLVTGASGFIGARIVETFYLTGYQGVRAGIRNYSSCSRIARFPVEIIKVDLLNAKEVMLSLDGVTTVIHCAYGPGGVTTNGTKNILKGALEKGIKQVIHLSTTEVYGNAYGEVNEDYACHYTGNPYGDSKLAAEKTCLEYADLGLPVTILRLPIVYGPFGRNWTINIAKMLITRKWGSFNRFGEGKCNLLYIDDLIRAITMVFERTIDRGQIFNINGPEIITWNEYLNRFNTTLGLPELHKIKTPILSLKTDTLKPVRILGNYIRKNHITTLKKVADRSHLIKMMLMRTEEVIKATPSQEQLNLFSRDVVYKVNKAKELLGYEPIFSIAEGLQITCEWLVQQGFLLGHKH